MKLNREQQAILFAAENGTLQNIAAEKVRRNEAGWQEGWTIEQHIEYMEKKVREWKEEMAKEAASTKKTWNPAGGRSNERYNGYMNNNDNALSQFGFGE